MSAERGESITFCGIINAIGNTIPPVLLIPRVRYKDSFANGAPTGSLVIASRSGYMTAEIFLKVLFHIKDNTNCCKESPILLLMDNHSSYTALPAIIYAKYNYHSHHIAHVKCNHL